MPSMRPRREKSCSTTRRSCWPMETSGSLRLRLLPARMRRTDNEGKLLSGSTCVNIREVSTATTKTRRIQYVIVQVQSHIHICQHLACFILKLAICYRFQYCPVAGSSGVILSKMFSRLPVRKKQRQKYARTYVHIQVHTYAERSKMPATDGIKRQNAPPDFARRK
jgi:hypothetical protein